MTPRSRYTFFIDEDQRAALAAIKERDGISESEQIRRAVKAWIAQKDVTTKTERKRASTRKRP
ncbi:MAG: hypothetical protein ABR606_17960 [Vicinamibacterales bacterium]